MEVPERYPIFFAKLLEIGYDVRGKVKYKRDANGLILDKEGRTISDDSDVEYIARNGQVNSDIPELLKKWDIFREDNKEFVW